MGGVEAPRPDRNPGRRRRLRAAQPRPQAKAHAPTVPQVADRIRAGSASTQAAAPSFGSLRGGRAWRRLFGRLEVGQERVVKMCRIVRERS